MSNPGTGNMDIDRAFGMISAMYSAILTLAILVALASAAILLAIAIVRVALNERRLRIGQRELDQSRLDPTGHPYPPSSRGLCARCHRVQAVVHYLKDGAGLCRTCYDRQVIQQASSPQPLGPVSNLGAPQPSPSARTPP